ncbi:MAG: amidohydrolase [Gemmatimonadetes bacterium]|nr:amidohydrolase [Gemmatimonadota bacterium]
MRPPRRVPSVLILAVCKSSATQAAGGSSPTPTRRVLRVSASHSGWYVSPWNPFSPRELRPVAEAKRWAPDPPTYRAAPILRSPGVMTDLLQLARTISPRLVEIRRDLHRNPELGFQENRTSALAAREVQAAGYSVRTGIAKTGVVAELVNGAGPTVAIRADMDALPIQEQSETPYASGVPGVMHACGHDFHTAGLIGVSYLLAELKRMGELPPGTIRLLFQPSEESVDAEGKSGAVRMIEEGAMEGVDAVVGLHVGGHLPAGHLYLREGPFWAGSDEVVVTVHGKSAHAARPHEGVDAIALASLGVVAAQQVVSRGISPSERGVLTFGSIRGGTAPNVLADRVDLLGTLRYFTADVRRRIQEGVKRAFAASEAMGGRCEVSFRGGYPPVVNDPTVTRWVEEAARPFVGDEGIVRAEPNLEAEDFAFLAQEAPGAFFWLGAALPEVRQHHHPRFDVDEDILPLGAAILAGSAVHFLRRLSEDAAKRT